MNAMAQAGVAKHNEIGHRPGGTPVTAAAPAV